MDIHEDPRPLIEQGKTDKPQNGVICRYDRQPCIYFPNGSFSSGSSDCPISITPGDTLNPETPTSTGLNPGSASPTGLIGLNPGSAKSPGLNTGSTKPETLAPVQVVCPAVDTQEDPRPLIEQGKIEDGVTCRYGRQLCIYFLNGSFSSGSSDCPTSITPGDALNPETPTSTGLNPGSASPTGLIGLNPGSDKPETLVPVQVVCPAVDIQKDPVPLTEQGKIKGGVTCRYGRQLCIYFLNGSFSSGSSICPISISPMAAQLTT